jgi:hypothetical protein
MRFLDLDISEKILQIIRIPFTIVKDMYNSTRGADGYVSQRKILIWIGLLIFIRMIYKQEQGTIYQEAAWHIVGLLIVGTAVVRAYQNVKDHEIDKTKYEG